MEECKNEKASSLLDSLSNEDNLSIFEIATYIKEKHTWNLICNDP